MSKKQGHALQVGSYARLLELRGYDVTAIATKNFHLETKGDVVESFNDEGVQDMTSTISSPLIDKIVKTPFTRKESKENREQTAEEKEYYFRQAQQNEPRQPDIEPVPVDKMVKINAAVNTWKKYLETLTHSKTFTPKNKSFEEVMNLIGNLRHLTEVAEFEGLNTKTEPNYQEAYREFLSFSNKNLEAITAYLTNPANQNLEKLASVALVSQTYIDTFQHVMDTEKYAKNNPMLRESLFDLRDNLQAALYAIRAALKKSSANVITTQTSSDTIRQDVERYVTTDRDINTVDFHFGDIANSNVSLIENADKLIKQHVFFAHEKTEEYHEKIKDLAKALIAATGKSDSSIFDFMYQRDKDGKKTGRVVSQLGQQYWNIRNSVENPLYAFDGSRLKYIEGTGLTKEQRAENIRLYKLKEKQRTFLEAENKLGMDGMYHMYTATFKAERALYMKKIPGGQWVPKVDDAAFKIWQNKNFDFVSYLKMITDKGQPTGVLKEENEFFPKKENVIARNITSDGRDMRDEGFKRLTTDKSALGLAQLDFYTNYRTMLGEFVEKLPPDVMDWFQKGYIPTLPANLIRRLSTSDKTVANIALQELKNLFSTQAFTNQSETNKTGSTGQSLPILYTGRLRNQTIVAAIEKELEQHVAKKQNAQTKQERIAWAKEFNRLKELKQRENYRLTGEDINEDLAEGLMSFADMAIHFEAMSGIEDTLQAVKQTLYEMTFTNKKGKEVAGKDSNAYKRFNEYMEMCFYNDENYTKEMAAVIAKRLKNITSLISIPGKLMAPVNNAIIASINNNLDSYGGDFYTTAAMRKMVAEFTAKALPGYVASWAEFKMSSDKKYNQKKFGSKYEALAHKYNMVEHYQDSQGRIDMLAKLGLYLGYEGGEWMVQTKVGNAILDSITVYHATEKNADGSPKSLSLYDAHVFDPNTNTLKLVDGYSESAKERATTHNRIRETNKRIHGNYRPIDKTYIEKYWLGQLAMQFKKWLVPFFKSRFQGAKYDENLGGGMDIEGRWTTALSWFKLIKETASIVDGWDSLTTHQQNNLKKDLMDLVWLSSMFVIGVVAAKLVEGVPDDDPYLKKMLNWLHYQSDRGFQEIALGVPGVNFVESWQLVKNPFAVTNSLMNFAQLLKATVQYPFVDDETRYYQRGPNKDQSHFMKELRDITPIWNNVGQFQMLENEKLNFFIR